MNYTEWVRALERAREQLSQTESARERAGVALSEVWCRAPHGSVADATWRLITGQVQGRDGNYEDALCVSIRGEADHQSVIPLSVFLDVHRDMVRSGAVPPAGEE